MSKYARKKLARGGSVKILQTLFHTQEKAIGDMKPYWDIIAKMQGNTSPCKEMMRIRLECFWEGREYAESYNRRVIANIKGTFPEPSGSEHS